MIPLQSLRIIMTAIFGAAACAKEKKTVKKLLIMNGFLLPYLSANYPLIIDPTKKPKKIKHIYSEIISSPTSQYLFNTGIVIVKTDI